MAPAASEVVPQPPHPPSKPWPRPQRPTHKVPLGRDVPYAGMNTLPERYEVGNGIWSTTTGPRTPGSAATAGRPGSGGTSVAFNSSLPSAPHRRPPRQRVGDALAESSQISEGSDSALSLDANSPIKTGGSVNRSHAAQSLTCDIAPLLAAARRNGSAPQAAAAGETRRAEALARLATPRTRGCAGEHSTRRAFAKEYEEYAQQAARELVPSAPMPERSGHAAFGDVWHTAGEDGYRSAVFHAAVRCRELLQSTGAVELVKGADGVDQVRFKGLPKNSGPELVRLHTACLLFEELIKVSSPLQDTLRFLFREFCHCIFDGFFPGSDILLLTPFFSIAFQSRQDAVSATQRLDEAEGACDAKIKECAVLKRQVEELRAAVQKEKNRYAEQTSTYESLKDERNLLREKLAQLQESADLRADELRELNSEHAKLQGSAYQQRRELEQARKEVSGKAHELKDQQITIANLQRKIDDLHDALAVMRDHDMNDVIPAPVIKKPVELPAELEQEVALLRRDGHGAHRKPFANSLGNDEKRGVDPRRLLKVPVADGGSQMIMKASSEEERGFMELGTSSAIKGHSTVVLVSRAVFAAFSIAMGLPRPPDLVRFSAKDDDEIVMEVQAEVLALAREHRSLLDMFRRLRQELKQTMRLIPEWNVDELRGILRSVLVLDPEEAELVPMPVDINNTLVGLGLGDEVPPFLRYDGLLRLRLMDADDVRKCVYEVWFAKTQTALEAVSQGLPPISLSEFLSVVYLPCHYEERTVQMEFSYNFLYALRHQTTLNEDDAHAGGIDRWSQGGVDEDGDGDESGAGKLRPMRIVNPSVHFHPGAEVLYRGLLNELHEDAWHDQTAMLVSLICTLAALSERLHPAHWNPPPSPSEGLPADEHGIPAVFGLAELSAILKLFFPSKPREHLSALKQILLAYTLSREEDDGVATPEPPETPKETAQGKSGKVPASKGASLKPPAGAGGNVPKDRKSAREALAASPAPSLPASEGTSKTKVKSRKPPLVDVGRVFGVELRQGCIAEKENFLSDLIGRPSPFVLELRRQHLCECFMFLDRLHKAFKVTAHKSASDGGFGGQADAGVVFVTVRQAESALVAADQYLTEDQRYVYLLRGFGRRLPDAPNEEVSAAGLIGGRKNMMKGISRMLSTQSFLTEGDDEESPAFAIDEAFRKAMVGRASKMHKLRTLLKERVLQLIEDGTTVATDLFVRRLGCTGVTKSSRAWQPGVSPGDVVQEAGLVTMRASTAAAPLEDFIRSPVGDVGDAARRHSMDYQGAAPVPMEEASDALGVYRKHVEIGRDVMELSVGYSALTLSFWLSSGL